MIGWISSSKLIVQRIDKPVQYLTKVSSSMRARLLTSSTLAQSLASRTCCGRHIDYTGKSKTSLAAAHAQVDVLVFGWHTVWFQQ